MKAINRLAAISDFKKNKWLSQINLLALGLIALSANSSAANATTPQCNLGNGIKHVVFIEFDNLEFHRMVPNVPSDLEQIPALYDFLRNNGTVSSNHHFGAIAHSAAGFTSSQVGLYADRTGILSNFMPLWESSSPLSPSRIFPSFGYWTTSVQQMFPGLTDLGADTPLVVDPRSGNQVPAPWATFTKAGCDVGATIDRQASNPPGFLSVQDPAADLKNIYGSGSPEAAEANVNPNLAYAKYGGVAVHCAQGSTICTNAPRTVPEVLPNEPGGYTSFSAVHGMSYLAPVIAANPNSSHWFDSAGRWLLINSSDSIQTNLTGDPIRCPLLGRNPRPSTPGATGWGCWITGSGDDSRNIENYQVGFPGIQSNQLTAEVSLSIGAAMLEAGIPVYFGRIDAARAAPGRSSTGVPYPKDPRAPRAVQQPPGTADHQAKLTAMNNAFTKFFAELASHNIDQSNTLFIFTVDEGETWYKTVDVGQGSVQFASDPPACDGVNTLCDWTGLPYGVTAMDLPTQLAHHGINPSTVAYDSDSSAVLLAGQPGPTADATRALGRALTSMQETNFYTGDRQPIFSQVLDDQARKALHFENLPQRNATLTAHYQFAPFGAFVPPIPGVCDYDPNTNLPGCPDNLSVYVHGAPGFSYEGWVGLAGPGVKTQDQGEASRSDVWSDNNDVRPTMMALLGLRDGYVHQGRVLAEFMTNLPPGIDGNKLDANALAVEYKQLNSPMGDFALKIADINTRAIATGTGPGGDEVYLDQRKRLTDIVSRREALVEQMEQMLNSAAFFGTPVNSKAVKNVLAQSKVLRLKLNALDQSVP